MIYLNDKQLEFHVGSTLDASMAQFPASFLDM